MPVRTRAQRGRDRPILPHEVWCNAFEHMEPSEVLFLGQVSRTLRTLVSEKSVWRAILRSVCRKYDLFGPSFPVEEMSVKELQRAALGPELFKALVTRHSWPADELHEAQILVPASDLTPFRKRGFKMGGSRSVKFMWVRHLVPGGRFLFQVTQAPNKAADGSFTVQLWDLGVPGSSPLRKPSLMAEIKNGKPAGLNVTAVTAMVDPENDISLRVATYLSGYGTGCMIKIHAISPSDPTFKRLAELHITNLIHNLHVSNPIVSGDVMLIRVNNTVVLWNFICHSYAAIPIAPIPTQKYSSDEHIVFTGDFVMVFRRGAQWGIHVWEVPALASFTRITGRSLSIVEAVTALPDALLPIPFPEPKGRHWHGINVPQSGLQTLPLTFDVFSAPWKKRSHPVTWVGPTSRTITSCLRCTIGTQRVVAVTNSTRRSVDMLSVDTMASFKIQAPVTGASWTSPQFAPSLSDSSLSFAFLNSRIIEHKSGDDYRVSKQHNFAYSLDTFTPLPTGPSSSSAQNASQPGQAASVSVTRFYEPDRRRQWSQRWSACVASGRMVDMACEGGDVHLLDYLY
ncbi:hypothetical protein DFP72DRAFT_891647 [Ephemerocybe angulata]|uniref:F-box domain-containing protein n=1 Tax=Ephemerocybe angulata TaxID=980116 RepID=A0A8H6MAH5_9AGAR|nr:hypothetical protein DFP72DRAFT_891647 [Tulosesus angulatus]